MATQSEPLRAPGDAPEPAAPAGGRAGLEPTLPVAAVARRLGIAPATLRTWDRRYGIGPSGHTTGQHRRYAPADVARLELMQRALLRGASPAEAAAYALRATPAPAGPNSAASQADAEAETTAVLGYVLPGQPVPEPDGGRPVRSGGRTLRLPGGTPRARGLARAALAMDAASAQQLVADAITERGVVPVWDEVIRPVLAAVAAHWEHFGEYVEVEHLLRECALAAVIGATPLVTAPRNPRPVLLGCVPEERHSLPLYVLRAALAGRGIGTQLLGAAVPAGALASAVRRSAPLAVVLWAQQPRYAWAAVFDQLPKPRAPVRLFACGPGWLGTDLPARVERLAEPAPAVDRIEALVDWRRA